MVPPVLSYWRPPLNVIMPSYVHQPWVPRKVVGEEVNATGVLVHLVEEGIERILRACHALIVGAIWTSVHFVTRLHISARTWIVQAILKS